MAAKAKTAQIKEEAPEKDEGRARHPAAAARSLRRRRQEDDQGRQEARLRHHEQLNAVLPSEEVTSDQIEDILAMISEMGINVVENEEADDRRGEGRRRGRRGRRVRGRRTGRGHDQVAATTEKPRAVRAHRRSRAHVSARNGFGRAVVARGRNRHRQAHRGRPRGDDRRPVRKPADLPGRHHLARRIERRQSLPARHHRPGSDLCRSRRQKMQAPVIIGPDGEPVPQAAGTPAPGAPHLQVVQTQAPPAAPPAATPFKAPGESVDGEEAKDPAESAAESDSTKTTWRIRCRSPPSRPSSSRKWSRPSTTSPTPSSGCAACRSRTSSSA